MNIVRSFSRIGLLRERGFQSKCKAPLYVSAVILLLVYEFKRLESLKEARENPISVKRSFFKKKMERNSRILQTYKKIINYLSE